MRFILKTFLQGLFTVLPIAATVYVLYYLFNTTDTLLSALLKQVLPDAELRYGLSVVVGLGLVFCVGLLMNAWLVKALFKRLEAFIETIPLVKTLYSSVRDLMGMFSSDEDAAMGQVVMVHVGDHRLIGFVTREAFDDLPDGIGKEGDVAVYVPMSYQIGGFTTIVPRDAVEPVDMSIEDAMRFAITAGVKNKDNAPKPKPIEQAAQAAGADSDTSTDA